MVEYYSPLSALLLRAASSSSFLFLLLSASVVSVLLSSPVRFIVDLDVLEGAPVLAGAAVGAVGTSACCFFFFSFSSSVGVCGFHVP